MNGWLLAFSESRGTQGRAGQRLIQAGPKPEVADRARTRAGLLTSCNTTQELATTQEVVETEALFGKEPRQTEAAQNKGRRPQETRPKNPRPLMNVGVNRSRITGVISAGRN
jgi:hypothetical protein